MPTVYVITVKGHLDDHWSAWFEGLTITNGANGEAMLAGLIVDQAALHGVLVKIRDLGLPLIAVVPGNTQDDDGTVNHAPVDERYHLDGNS
jgi:hypothetical protein